MCEVVLDEDVNGFEISKPVIKYKALQRNSFGGALIGPWYSPEVVSSQKGSIIGSDWSDGKIAHAEPKAKGNLSESGIHVFHTPEAAERWGVACAPLPLNEVHTVICWGRAIDFTSPFGAGLIVEFATMLDSPAGYNKRKEE